MSAEDRPAYPRVSMLWPPAYADRELLVIWNADGTPYRVKPSPGLCIPLGDGATVQALFRRPGRP